MNGEVGRKAAIGRPAHIHRDSTHSDPPLFPRACRAGPTRSCSMLLIPRCTRAIAAHARHRPDRLPVIDPPLPVPLIFLPDPRHGLPVLQEQGDRPLSTCFRTEKSPTKRPKTGRRSNPPCSSPCYRRLSGRSPVSGPSHRCPSRHRPLTARHHINSAPGESR